MFSFHHVWMVRAHVSLLKARPASSSDHTWFSLLDWGRYRKMRKKKDIKWREGETFMHAYQRHTFWLMSAVLLECKRMALSLDLKWYKHVNSTRTVYQNVMNPIYTLWFGCIRSINRSVCITKLNGHTSHMWCDITFWALPYTSIWPPSCWGSEMYCGDWEEGNKRIVVHQCQWLLQ